MSKKFLVVFDRAGCIGAAACAAMDPKHWEIVDDGKAVLKGSKKKGDSEDYELEIEEADFKLMMDSAQGCPVNVIHIIDKETGKKLI